MAQERVVRNKPHVNVGTIGHIDHGEEATADGGDREGPVEKGAWRSSSATRTSPQKGGTVRDETKTLVTIAVAHVEYESDRQRQLYAHVDCAPVACGLHQEP